jgi:hypothetical protein
MTLAGETALGGEETDASKTLLRCRVSGEDCGSDHLAGTFRSYLHKKRDNNLQRCAGGL